MSKLSITRMSRNNVFAIIIPVYSLLFLLTIVTPIYIQSYNPNDITWEINNWIFNFFKSIILSLPVIALGTFSPPRIRGILFFFLSICFVYVLLRVFFIPVDFGILEGVNIELTEVKNDKSLIVSIILLSVLALIYYFKSNLFRSLFTICTVLSIIACTIFTIFRSKDDKTTSDNTHSTFSTNSNVIILSFDAVQGDFFNLVLENTPSFTRHLNGFTHYRDVTSYAPNTVFSILSTMSGQHLPTGPEGNTLENLISSLKPNSLPSIMSENGYAVDLFNIFRIYLDKGDAYTAKDVIPKSQAIGSNLSAYDVLLLKIFPKSVSWNLVNIFTDNHARNLSDKIKNDKSGNGHGVDLFAFQSLSNNQTLIKNPVFKFHHYLFTHQPVRFDKSGEYDSNREQNYQAANDELTFLTICLKEFINSLKKRGIYDNSLIIITSDHGYASNVQPNTFRSNDYEGGIVYADSLSACGRYNPTLLIKLPFSSGKLQLSDRKTELIDILPTIVGALDLKLKSEMRFDGRDLYNDQPKSTRKIMVFNGGLINKPHRHKSTSHFETIELLSEGINGISSALNTNILARRSLHNKSTIDFSKGPSNYALKGISGISGWGRWTNGHQGTILFNFSDDFGVPETLRLNVTGYVSADHKRQSANLYLNEIPIGNIEITDEGKITKEFNFPLPPDSIKLGSTNQLVFELENPASPLALGKSNDARLLGFGLRSLSFE